MENTLQDPSCHAWISRRGFKVLDSFSVSGTWILDSYRSEIPDSLSCIPDSKAQKSGIPN